MANGLGKLTFRGESIMTRLGYEAGGNEDNYVEKCMKCKHSYTKKNESDTLFCSLKECKYEERKTK